MDRRVIFFMVTSSPHERGIGEAIPLGLLHGLDSSRSLEAGLPLLMGASDQACLPIHPHLRALGVPLLLQGATTRGITARRADGRCRVGRYRPDRQSRPQRAPRNARRGVGRARSESTRLNSSHVEISYAVFCLKKKKKKYTPFYIIKKNKYLKIQITSLGIITVISQNFTD